MKSARWWMGLFVGCVVAFVETVLAETEIVGGVTWGYTVSNGVATVTNANPASGNLTIPASLGGIPVEGIGDGAFRYCSDIQSVTIPDSVSDIGKDAFAYCSTWTGDIWDMHVIGLERVAIGNGVTNIGADAFAGCELLADVAWGSNVQCVGEGAFKGCGLTSLEIPDSVEEIGKDAFLNSPIQRIVIGAGTSSIGAGAFSVLVGGYTSADGYGWSGTPGLLSISVDERNPSYEVQNGVLFSKDGHSLLLYPNQLSGQNYVIPDTVQSVLGGAFRYCTNLVSVTIPNGVTAIGNSAFYNCSGLTELIIPDSVTSIGDSAFQSCGKLDSLTLSENLTNIRSNVFYNCSKLSALTIPNGVTNIGSRAFYGCSQLTRLTIPNGVANVGDYAFYECKSLPELVLPESVMWIGQRMCYNCTGLTSVILGDNVKDIGSFAFGNCSNLLALAIPSSVTNIGADAFYQCRGLKSLAIPDSVTDIGKWAFDGCSGLTTLALGSGVTNIGSYAFRGCSHLVSLRLPASVTSIGERAFDSCAGLTEILVDAGNPAYASEAGVLFSKDKSLLIACPAGKTGTCVFPAEVSRVQGYAFYQCSGLKAIMMQDSVENIGDDAFSGCSGLSSVTLSGAVTNIGRYAFYGCSKLASLSIPDGVEAVGYYGFSGCNGLRILDVPTSWYGTDKLANVGLRGDCEVKYKGIEKLLVETAALPSGKVGSAYETALRGSGGLPPYAWSRPDAAYLETVRGSTYLSTGTAQGWQADEGCWDLALPFEFPFFGNTYTNVKVNCNGALSFGTNRFSDSYYTSNKFYNTPIIAAWWRNMSTTNGDVYVERGEGWIKVEWRGGYWYDEWVDEYIWYEDWSSAAFSATLHEDGTIVLSPASIYYDGTIGLSAGDGSTVVFPQLQRKRSDDIVFEPSGDLPPGVELTADGVLTGTPWRSGEYAFRAIVTDAAGVHASRMLSLPIAFADLGEGATVHTGAIEKDETWSAGIVHVVDAKVTVRNGATVTIEPGAVVKFTPGSTLVVNGGGRCLAEGVVFTHLHDDTIGGDTLGDGTSKTPVLDEYSIKESVVADLTTEWRWLSSRPSETWRSGKVYVVDGTLNVAGGTTLTIERGAVVKFTSGSSLVVSSNGTCVAYGAIFTHIHDDTVGGDTMGDGNDIIPSEDEYSILGNVLKDGETEMRYLTVKTSGTLSGSNTWGGHKTYRVTGNLTVGSGATLNILPGAIVKFDAGVSLTVNSGGTLNAVGTRAEPIVFTSVKDDEHGGDTNGDGDATKPNGGDWGTIVVSGIANFNHAIVQYGGSDVMHLNSGGTIVFDNSELSHSPQYCVDLEGGSWSMQNSVFKDFYTAFRHWSTTFSCINSVFYDCSYISNNGGQSFVNCVFEKYAIGLCWWTDNCTYRNCVFWNEKDAGPQSCPHAGSNGNTWGAPGFMDVDNGDFRIQSGSPCIDAGDGSVAPECDSWGQPRMDEPEVPNTGIAAANGAVPDIGIHEYLPRVMLSDVDLAVTGVECTAEAARIGGEITASWTVENLGSKTAGTWRDVVELVAANGAVVTLGEKTTAGIPAGGTWIVTEQFTVPAVEPGAARVRVKVNPYRDIFEGTLTGNNTALSEGTVDIQLPSWSSADAGKIVLAADASVAYRIPAGSGTTALVISGGNGTVAAWAATESVPAALRYDVAAETLEDGRLLLSLPKDAGERDYNIAIANDGTGSVTLQTVEVTTTVGLLEATPERLANTGAGYLTLTGVGMDQVAGVRLSGPASIELADVRAESPARLTGTADLAGVMPGTYAIVLALSDGSSVRTEKTVNVYKPTQGAKLEAWLDIPSSVRQGRMYAGRICFANTGDEDMPAPLLALVFSGAQVRLPGEEEWQDETLYVMGVSPNAPAGVLRPGEEASLVFEFVPGPSPFFSLRMEGDETAEWAAKRAALSDAATRVNRRGRLVARWGRLEQYVTLFAAGTNAQAVCGLLLDECDGTPLSGARVVAIGGDGTTFAGDTVDEGGRFVLEGFQGPTNVLLAVESGACVHSRQVDVPESGDVLDLTWTGLRGYDVEIAFRRQGDAEDGKTGIVELVHAGTGLIYPGVVSEGKTSVSVYCPGEYTATAVAGNGLEMSKTFSIGETETSVSLTFDFSEGGSASGTVTDEAGNRIAGTVVTIQSETDASYSRTVTANENGEWAVGCLPPGNYVAVVSAPGAGTTTPAAFTVADKAATTGLVLGVVSYGNTLSVAVENAPESGTALFTMRSGDTSDFVGIAEDGSCRFDGLPEGIGTIRIYDADGNLAAMEEDVLIKAGGNDRTVSIDTNKAVFVGIAKDETGKPVRAEWWLLAPNADGIRVSAPEADGDGKVAFEVRKADYWGQASAPGFMPEAFHVRLDRDKEVSVVLRRGGFVGHILPENVNGAGATVAFRTTSASAAAFATEAGPWIAGPLAANEIAEGFVVHASGAYLTEETAVRAGTTGIVSKAASTRPLDIRFGDSAEVTQAQLELKGDIGFTATFGVPGNHLVLAEFPRVETEIRAYSADGSLVATATLAETDTQATVGTDVLMTVSGTVTGGKPGQCAGGTISFCTADGVTLAVAALSGSGAFRSTAVPARFERVWIVLSDGTSFSFGKAEAVGLGWRLPLPENLGEVNYQFNDKDGTPLSGLPIVVTFADGFRTSVQTDSGGRVTVKHETSGSVTLKIANTEDAIPPQTPTQPAVCPTCGQNPCVCKVANPCSVCGADPCICRIETRESPANNENTQTTVVPDPVDLPPLRTGGVQEIHYHDWTIRESLWYDPLVERFHDLRDRCNQYTMSSPPRVCPDPHCSYCEARFGAYNQAVWNRYRILRGIEAQFITHVGEELSELQRISRTLHQQQLVGTIKVVAAVGITIASSGSTGYAAIGWALADFGVSTTLDARYEYLEVEAGGQSSPDGGDIMTNFVLDNIQTMDEYERLARQARYNTTGMTYLNGNGDLVHIGRVNNASSSGVGDVAKGVQIGLDVVKQTIRWRSHDEMMNARIRAMDQTLAQFAAVLAMTVSAANTPYKICDRECAFHYQIYGKCDCNEKSSPIFLHAASKKGPSSQAPSVPKSYDPNEMGGPAGAGERRVVEAGEWAKYTVYFENKSDAAAAAQEVRVALNLDPGLDWSTFEMGEVSFGKQLDNGLAGKKRGTSETKMDGADYHVQTETAFDEGTGKVEWYLRIIDKTTPDRWPKDLYAGILPPNDATGRGEGHLTYRVKVRDNAVPGSIIRASANIVFDYNEAIETDPAWWNTVGETGEVTLNLEDGEELSLGIVVGEAYGKLPEPVRLGWAFAGWFTGPDGTGTEVTTETEASADTLELFAKWVRAVFGELWLDVTHGSVVVGTNGVTAGYAPDGSAVEGLAERYVLTGTSSVHSVRFAGGSFTNTWTNLVVDLDAKDAVGVSLEGARVEVNLEGNNFVGSGEDCAGIRVDEKSALVLQGTGRLETWGGAYGAGIGGGLEQKSGRIEIRGGTVEAMGGDFGAGIGGGLVSPAAEVSISGGSVKARGKKGADIGSGYGEAAGAGPTDGRGAAVREVEVPFATDTDALPVTAVVDLGGGRTYRYEGMGHRDDTSLWFWLPDGTYDFEADGDDYGVHVDGAKTVAVFTDPGNAHFAEQEPALAVAEPTAEGWRLGLDPAYRTTPFELWTATELKGSDWDWKKPAPEAYRFDAETGAVEWKGATPGLRVFRFLFLPKE